MNACRTYRLRAIAIFGALFFLNACAGRVTQSAVPIGNFESVGALVPANPAGAYQVIYPFGGGLDGGNAATQLVFDSQGNAYGTTVQGGNAGCGTVFRLHLVSGQWHETVLYNFGCFADGKNPHGGVVRDSLGNLYGTTVAGGLSGGCTGDGCGVIFEIKHGGGEAVLYTFQGKDDGFGPGSPLTFGPDGTLYGTAPDGGAHSSGTVFSINPNTHHFQVIHPFSGGDGGSTGSLGALLVTAKGAIYGVTELGGAHQAGIAYRLTHPSGSPWKFEPIYTFKGQPDAANPYGGLIEVNGKFYGTTYFGGTAGAGSVFELTPASGTFGERVVYSFKGGTDGSSPTSTLVAGPGGAVYGTTSAGGRTSCGCGTVFALAKSTLTESVLHRFGALHDGQNPYYGLTQFGSTLYSSTVAGGTSGSGTIFSITP
ncbi:MAG TPA: choice-of-anchor tandem repeat GloVer-containing protein [Candidatus Baltobacteraceae bacterium]|jgi:uncharacterized repeat protein (TIGR03803 family)|nr:choice-of-anchor tandem repeat GloVer-containing protein [Candidatus Baltobacteraceae bacterium]